MPKYALEDIRNSEEARINHVLDTLEEWSDLYEKMNKTYLDKLSDYQHERREMLKYLATIAGGGAALSPQLLDHVHHLSLFYWGIGLLCLVVIIATTNVLSSVENDMTKLSADLNQKNDWIKKIRQPKIDFITGTDRDLITFSKAMAGGMEIVPTKKEMLETKNKSWYRSLDYTGEFVILFSITGFFLLAISLPASLVVSLSQIIYVIVIAFVLINIISTFPGRVFQIMGAPIDLIKSLPRLFNKSQRT